jgi:hypothetical protein
MLNFSRARRVGRRSEYEIVCTSDPDEVDDSEFDGMAIKLHNRFEKVDYLPNLNLRKVDKCLAELAAKEKGCTEKCSNLEEELNVEVGGSVEAKFCLRYP